MRIVRKNKKQEMGRSRKYRNCIMMAERSIVGRGEVNKEKGFRID
jgi:hypothetical protein